MADPSGGFTVDPAALQAAASQLGRAYDDIQTTRTDFAGNQCYAASAFGDFGVDTAWSGFDTAWAAELQVTGEAIDELRAKTAASAHGYAQAESVNTGLMGSK